MIKSVKFAKISKMIIISVTYEGKEGKNDKRKHNTT